MNDERKEEAFAKQARELFDDSVERLDAATLSRLNRGRQLALEELHRGRPVGHWVRWVPAAGVAAAAAVALVVWQGMPTGRPVPATTTATDFEILMSEDSLEMIEDLEFYSWIGPADLDAGGNVG